jgi:hypothetical protein
MFPTTSLSGGGPIKSNFGAAGSTYGKGKISGHKYAQLPTMSPEQSSFFKALLGQVQPGALQGTDFLSRLAGGDEDLYSQLEKPAFTAFNQAGAQLGSRFSGLGMGAQNSSGFQNSLAGAAGELGERLASQRMGLQQNAIAELLGLSKSLLGESTFQNFLVPPRQKSPGFLDSLGGGIGSSLGKLFGIFGG